MIRSILLLLTMLMLGATTSYSQMIFDFHNNDLVTYKEYWARNKKAKITNYAGEIYLKSGEIIKGNFFIPNSNKSNSNYIRVTCFPDAKKIKLNSEDIDIIQVYSTNNAQTYSFIYTSYIQDASYKKESVQKRAERTYKEVSFERNNKKVWAVHIAKGKADLYLSATGYKFSYGKLEPYVTGNLMPPFLYLGQVEGRDNELILVHLGGVGGNEKYFRGFAPAFFEGHHIPEKIKHQEDVYKYGNNGNIENFIDIYNEVED